MNRTHPSSIFAISKAVLLLALPVLSSASRSAEDPSARIDALIEAKLSEAGKEPLPEASEEVFVRRAYLDLVGRIPTRAETIAFLESENPAKRDELVDSLIGSDGYVSHWYNYWADLLRARTSISGNNQSIAAGMAYELWIKDALRNNKPYDKFVFELVTAEGSSWENPAVSYYLRDFGMPLDNLAITTQVFLGTQIVCAQCHDHPFDEWTQMDYYHLAAFTYPQQTTNNHPLQKKAVDLLEEKKGKVGAEEKRNLNRAFSEILFPLRFNNVVEIPRSLRLPHDYQYDDARPKSVVEPATLMGKEAILSPSKSVVDSFGEWLVSPENPRFTQVIANRLWKEAFGVGLIEPVDDLKEHTTASHPELMEYLEELLKELDYDLQAYQRILYRTELYGREASVDEPVPGAPYDFAGPILRRMSAEQIWDSLVSMVVENPDRPSSGRALAAEERRLVVELVAEAVYDQRPGQFLRNAREIEQAQRKLSVEIEAAEEKVRLAREADDPALIEEAGRAAREIRERLYRIVEEQVYREGLESKLAAYAADGAAEDEGFLAELSEAMAASEGELLSDAESMETGGKKKGGYGRTDAVIEPLVDRILADRSAELVQERKTEQNRQKKQWGVETKEDEKYFRNFVRTASRMERASEINSPAPPGHFLREFGQSDRELVENSTDEASITQALALLNGPVLSAVTSKYSVLSRDMKGENFRDRLDTIYLTMFSRLPTNEERTIFRTAWDSDPGTGTVSGIVWTLLNTRQFLFIQ